MSGSAGLRISAFGDEIAAGLEDQLATLSECGVAGLELRAAWGVNVAEMGLDELSRAERLLRESRIAVSAVGSPIGKVPIDSSFEAELERFGRVLRAAERLGTPLVRVFSFFIPGGRYEEHRDEVLRRMARLAGEAEQAGFTLVHENESYIYGDTPERCADLLQSVASPALRAAFDPANFVQVGARPLADAWHGLEPFVAHFHVKDAVPVDRSGLPPYPARVPEEKLMDSVRLPGQGAGDLAALLARLRARDYQGWLTIEPHLRRRLPDLDGPARFRASLEALTALLSQTGVRRS